MPSETLRRHVFTGAILVFGPLAPVLFSAPVQAGEAPPRLEISGRSAGGREPFAPRGTGGKRGSKGPESSSTWWLGTGGIALALAACGGISLASKRYLPPRNGPGPLRVIGRTSLSPKHSVYLLEVGRRVLIVGTGTQGAPSLLGELTEPIEPAEPGPPRTIRGSGPTVSVPIGPGPSTGRFDRRVGDDE